MQMAGKLLRGLGVLFVLLPLLAAVAGFLVLKDRVTIVFAADQAAASGPDPVALLRDDVHTLQAEVTALQQAVGGNFQRLGEGLEASATARHADVQALRAEVTALRRQFELLGSDAALRHAELLARSVATGPGPASEKANDPVAPATAAPTELRTAPAAVPTTAPAAPKPAGFLSFSLPNTTFQFAAAQDYVLLPELSRVGFDGKSTLHDFSGVTSQVRGQFRADFDDPEGAWSGQVVVQAASLKTGVDGRDDGLRERLDTAHHPELLFSIERFAPTANGIDVEKQTATGELLGTMTIRGQARSVRMPLQIEVDPQKRVVVRGSMPLKLSDYGVPVPSQLGVINMQDEVVVWVALRARQQAEARK